MTARISECGYCGETQFTQWHSKDAPRDQHGRIDRDYLDCEPVAYCSEEHRDAADALARRREAALEEPVHGEAARQLADQLEDTLHQPDRDTTPFVAPLDVELSLARETLAETAGASIHDHNAMIRAAVALDHRLRAVLAAIDAERGESRPA